MLKPKQTDAYFFVDESGDTTFYRKRQLSVGKNGCPSYFILGFVETQNPVLIRAKLARLQEDIRQDPKYQGIYTLPKSLASFHAKVDHVLIRHRVFDLLPDLDFRAQFLIVRKKGLEEEFATRFKGDSNHMYDQSVSILFSHVLHRYRHNNIYFSARGNKTRQLPLRNAIEFAFEEFASRMGKKPQCTHAIQAQRPTDEPCLSVIDYMTWAVQRAVVSNQFEYLEQVRPKISLILDRYHPEGIRRYTRAKPLTVENFVPIEEAALL